MMIFSMVLSPFAQATCPASRRRSRFHVRRMTSGMLEHIYGKDQATAFRPPGRGRQLQKTRTPRSGRSQVGSFCFLYYIWVHGTTQCSASHLFS
jgi:hypothetical protein